MSTDTNGGCHYAHRTRTNRPAYFDEYRAAFERLAEAQQVPRHIYVHPADPQPGDTVEYWPQPRTDWRDGTDEGWGE